MVGRSDNGGGGGVAGKDRADFRNTHIVATWRVATTRQRQRLESGGTGRLAVRRLSRSDCPEVTADCPLLCHYIAACLAFESGRSSLRPGSCQSLLRMLSPFATVFRRIWAWSSERRGSWPEGHAEYTCPGLPCRKAHPGRPVSALLIMVPPI